MANSGKPVLGRPPVDGTEAEKDEWVKSFVDMILGPDEEDEVEG